MKLIGERLFCTRGGRTLFSDLSFQVGSGEALLLLGPNGSGKTTLIRTIAGLNEPEGQLRLGGGEPDRELGEHAHYVGHLNGFKPSFTVEENAIFWADFLGGRRALIAPALASFGLENVGSIPAAYLSAGQKRRLALVRLLLAHRPLWLLDEPSVSLDHAGQLILRQHVNAHLAAGGLVVAATHVPLGFSNVSELRLGAVPAPSIT